MFQLINDIVLEYRKCFKREKTWRWFVIIILGLIIRSNNRGITSIISSLRLKPRLYHAMLHFFRSTGYTTETIYEKWFETVIQRTNLIRIANRIVLIGDHIKIPKEGLHMPDIKMLRQDSQNSGKAEYIAGHNYGQVSAVITDDKTSRSIPLKTELQMSPPKQPTAGEPEPGSLVVQMMDLVTNTARMINEPAVTALDAYFSSSAAWSAIDNTKNENGEKQLELVTRAQTNTVGYAAVTAPSCKKRGRPRKYGDRVVLYDLFADMSKFTESTMTLYGRKMTVKHLCVDLFWKPAQQLVRFIVVESANGRCVLMSSSLSLTDEEIIAIYALRFKIETSFDEQKNDVGSFAYHFWTTAMPKFMSWKSIEPSTDRTHQRRVHDTKRATQTYVCLATIAAGILTIIAFTNNRQIWSRYSGWLKTLRSNIPSIAIVKETLLQDFQGSFDFFIGLPLFDVIRPLRRSVDFLYRNVA